VFSSPFWQCWLMHYDSSSKVWMRLAIDCSWVSSSEILNRGDKMVEACDETDSWYLILTISTRPWFFLFNRIYLRLVIFKGSDVYWTVHHCGNWKKKPKNASILSFRRVLYVVCFIWVIPRRLSSKSRRFGTHYRFHLHRSMKLEQIEGSETSDFRTQTPGNYPKENILQINTTC